MKLVIVSGHPATGKTAVGERIARDLGYKFCSKDAIKEKLFNSGTRTTWDYGWYERRAKDKFYKTIATYMAKSKPLVIEMNFTPQDKRRLRRLLTKDVKIVEIYCTAKGFTIIKRFIKRNEGGIRHRGHHDRRWYLTMISEELLSYTGIRWPYKPLNYSSDLLTIDTNNIAIIDYKAIVQFVVQA